MLKEYEILRIPVGNRMDAVVAEQVMGWHWQDFPSEDDAFTSTGMWLDKHNRFWHNDNWKPSTKIIYALDVIDKFTYYEIKRLGGRYNVYIENDDNVRTGVAQEDSLPFAICRAALLAIRDMV
jgi:hypothetical protein